jgi:RNA polymerase subunit RPABC4/transcription elongation factor Spt4
MTYCVKCGYSSPENEEYCSECNDPINLRLVRYGRLEEKAKNNLQAMTRATTENRYCEKCEKVFPPSQENCPVCGETTKSLDESQLD